MRSIVTVLGKDQRGIIAGVSAVLSAHEVNIEDISQTIMQDYFVMIMMVDLSASAADLPALRNALAETGEKLKVQIQIQHEALFQAMHRV